MDKQKKPHSHTGPLERLVRLIVADDFTFDGFAVMKFNNASKSKKWAFVVHYADLVLYFETIIDFEPALLRTLHYGSGSHGLVYFFTESAQ